VGRTNDADVAAPLQPTSLIRTVSALHKLTASVSFTGSTGVYRTCETRDRKGEAVREGFYFTFGKLE
jgi:hypothetical protein